MNYLVSIPSDAGILALKLKAVAGDLTTANSDTLSVDDEFIAICAAEASVVVFEADTTVLTKTIPEKGVPTGNYQLYYSFSDTTPVWNLFADMGTISVVNNDLGVLLDEKAVLSTVTSDIAQLQSDVSDLDTQQTTNTAAIATNLGYINALRAKVYKTEDFEFDYSNITNKGGVPAIVERGAFHGFTLPIYAADDQELFACLSMPLDWDTSENPIVKVGGWLASANNAKKFNLQLSAQAADMETNEVLLATTEDYEVETTTGNWAAHTSFAIEFTLDRSALGASGLKVGQPLVIRIRRLAASADEITGNPIIKGACLKYVSDKMGGAI